MPYIKSASKLVKRDIIQAWQLLNKLTETLKRLSTDAAELADVPKLPAKRGRKPKSLTAPANQKKTRAAGRTKQKGLPDTRGDFFARHVARRKQTASQIFASVLDSLGFEPSKEQAAVLRNRLLVWLSNAVKSGMHPVASVGSGKERRYYKART